MDRCLFFDIECANCFNGEGKICSFGYVVTDMSFNILDSDDIVINPDCEFDWALFSKVTTCSLAYPKSVFYSSPLFPHYYSRISRLFSQCKYIFGFAPKNDIGFLDYTCGRYKLASPKGNVYDVVDAFNIKDNQQMRLVKWAEYYDVDMTDLRAHNSMDDAKMAMLCLKAFCNKYEFSLETLLPKLQGTDMHKYAVSRRERKQQKENIKKLHEIMSIKNYPASTNLLFGRKFIIGIRCRANGAYAYDVIKFIRDNGGTVVKSPQKNATVVISDSPGMNKNLPIYKKMNLEVIAFSKLKLKIIKKD